MSQITKRVAIVGSGLGGLATAIRLAATGFTVDVFEKQCQPGGRASVWSSEGFTFDTGPTVITAPWLLEDLFSVAGEQHADHVTLVPLDPFYRIFFDDMSSFDYARDGDEMDANVARLSAFETDQAGYAAFLKRSAQIFDRGFTELSDRPFLDFLDMLGIAPSLVRLQSFRSVYGLVSSFVQDERLRQILSFHPLLIGGNPFTTTSIYALIHHLERKWGVWFAMGGTTALVRELCALATRLGVTFHFNAEVVGLECSGELITGVRLVDGTLYPVDIVVSNADPVLTETRLLPKAARSRVAEWRLKRMDQSMSLVVIYFGTNKTYRDQIDNKLAHHNIIFGPRYRDLLKDIFETKVLAPDFSLYLHMPTVTDSSLAPEGCETFYVLAPVPNLAGKQDWSELARPYRDAIMAKLERDLLPGLSDHIVVERMIDPRYFRDDLNSFLGAGFSVEPKLLQSAWFRPHNRSNRVRNLYLVGAGTHPGAGIPGVLQSARIAADLIPGGMVLMSLGVICIEIAR